MQQLQTLLTIVFGENHLYGSPHTTIPGKRERYGHEEKGRIEEGLSSNRCCAVAAAAEKVSQDLGRMR